MRSYGYVYMYVIFGVIGAVNIFICRQNLIFPTSYTVPPHFFHYRPFLVFFSPLLSSDFPSLPPWLCIAPSLCSSVLPPSKIISHKKVQSGIFKSPPFLLPLKSMGILLQISAEAKLDQSSAFLVIPYANRNCVLPGTMLGS